MKTKGALTEMGKRVSGTSLKASSKVNENKQLNKLMKVVRPKVYITDSLSFKSLVQELTGNGTALSSSCLPPPSIPQKVEKVVTLDGEDHCEQESSSMEVSFDASVESCNNQFCSAEGPKSNQSYNQLCFNGQQSEYLTTSQQADMLACQTIESWLLDMEQYASSGNFTRVHQEDVSIYDYELAGLL